VFAAVFTTLTVSSYLQESATIDESHHLVTGYAALVLRDYRLDPEHPPFLPMYAALPLLSMSDVRLNTNTLLWTSGSGRVYEFCHEFMYVNNDADRLLYRARLMSVLLGVLLGILLFCWGRELFSFWTSTIVLGLYCLEPNILANFGLVTTDGGVTCFILGTAYFLWRTTRQLSPQNLTGLAVFFALAQVSKFSALILCPITLELLAIRVFDESTWPCTVGSLGDLTILSRRFFVALGVVLTLALTTYIAIWATYRFQYAPAPPGGGLDWISGDPTVRERVPTLAAVVDWVDQNHLLPNVYAQGFLIAEAKTATRTAYLFGQFSNTGWWYYFPVAFLIKTPITLIVLFIAGLALCAVNRSKLWEDDIYVLLPLAMYLGISMTMHINIGLRHILPIYPFVLLIGGKAVAAVLASRRKLLAMTLAALCLLQVGAVSAIHPYYLAFFNQFVGGPKNGYKYLADSNLDWGQDLKRLKKWMDANGVDKINLAYFGSADPAYYGIHCTHLRGSLVFTTNKIEEPFLPGLVAVSVNNLTGANLDGDQFYKPLLDAKPVAVIGYSIRVYRVDKPWW
jgi:hypothetical protein